MPLDAHHFNRFELKYILERDRANDFLAGLAEYVHPDPHCTDDRGYEIYSLYVDSPDRALFWEKVEGIKYRRKVRFRRYGESPDVYLEIKQRIDRTVQKRRVRWPLQRVAETFFSGELNEQLAGEEPDAVTSEIFFLWRHYNLGASLGTSYRRRAYFANNESDLRITLDTRVQYHPTEPDLSYRPETAKSLIDPTLAILELKFSQAVPLWLCRKISRAGLKMIRLSKYCSAVDREYYRGQLT